MGFIKTCNSFFDGRRQIECVLTIRRKGFHFDEMGQQHQATLNMIRLISAQAFFDFGQESFVESIKKSYKLRLSNHLRYDGLFLIANDSFKCGGIGN